MTATEQRMSALQKANEIRFARAHLGDAFREGTLDPIALLLDPPREFASMRVERLLLSIRGMGPAHMKKMLCFVSPTRPLERLTERERLEIAGSLTDWMDARGMLA